MSDVKETFQERMKRVTAWLGNTHATQSVQDLIPQSSNEELANLFYQASYLAFVLVQLQTAAA